MQKKAIDISAWQGNPDFNKIKASGIEQIILRSGCGKSADKSFARSASECERLSIPYGVYWFIYAVNEKEAEQNALACINTVRGKKLSLPVFADMEYDSESYCRKRGVILTKDLASRIVKKFLDTVAAQAYKVGNYTNLDWYKRFFNDSVNKCYDQWIAMWGSATAFTNAAPIWQYSSKGKVAGITGNVDMDYVHKDYTADQPINPDVPVVPVNPDTKVHKIPACYSLIFDPEWYLFTYKDLQKWITDCIKEGIIGGTQDEINWQLYVHFLTCGMDEADNGRYGCPTFNVKKYKAAMTDLQKEFGDVSYKPYYNHYMLTGAQEIADGKRAKVDLTV